MTEAEAACVLCATFLSEVGEVTGSFLGESFLFVGVILPGGG